MRFRRALGIPGATLSFLLVAGGLWAPTGCVPSSTEQHLPQGDPLAQPTLAKRMPKATAPQALPSPGNMETRSAGTPYGTHPVLGTPGIPSEQKGAEIPQWVQGRPGPGQQSLQFMSLAYGAPGWVPLTGKPLPPGGIPKIELTLRFNGVVEPATLLAPGTVTVTSNIPSACPGFGPEGIAGTFRVLRNGKIAVFTSQAVPPKLGEWFHYGVAVKFQYGSMARAIYPPYK